MIQTENVHMRSLSQPLLLVVGRYVYSNLHWHPLFTTTRATINPSPHMRLLVEEGVVDRQGKCRANSGPAGSCNRSVLEPYTKVPSQMSQAVDAVEKEWQSNSKLGRCLSPQWPCGDRRDYGLALEMPAQRGSSEVCNAEEVETAAENYAGDAVEAGGVPGDLWFVDGQMRGDGTLEALFCKDLFTSALGVCKSDSVLASRVLGMRVDGVSSW